MLITATLLGGSTQNPNWMTECANSTETTNHSVPICVDLPPGAAHISRIFSPSLGASAITGRKLEAPWRMNGIYEGTQEYIMRLLLEVAAHSSSESNCLNSLVDNLE